MHFKSLAKKKKQSILEGINVYKEDAKFKSQDGSQKGAICSTWKSRMKVQMEHTAPITQPLVH